MSSNLFGPFFKIKNHISGDPGCNATHLRTTRPAVPSHLMEGMALFRDAKPIDFTIPNLVDFPAKSVPDLLLKKVINSSCRLNGPSVLFYIFKPFAANH